MAGSTEIEDQGTFFQQLVPLMIVVGSAWLGGFLIRLMGGTKLPGGREVKPLCTAVIIPPLVGMIVFGCLARNIFASQMDFYPENKANWIRQICLSIILFRGGMELNFKGKGLIVVLLTLMPQFSEAGMVCIASHFIFGLPWALAGAFGFILGAVSPAVVVPGMMILHEKKFGVEKGIPTTLIAASSFDDIFGITFFGLLSTIAFQQRALQESSVDIEEVDVDLDVDGDDSLRFLAGGESEGSENLWLLVGTNVFQILAGLIIGLSLGYSMKIFNRFEPKNTIMIKFFLLLAICIFTPIVAHLSNFHEAKYIGIIFFGYMCYQVWGVEKPEHEFHAFWEVCQPFLFGTVGAAVIFSKIDPSQILGGLLVIFLGVSARWTGTFFAAFEKKYTFKERAFMAFAWIPKATVQAAIGGLVLADARAKGYTDYEDFGQFILTTAVLAVCITAPAGAICINTFGEKWLEHNPDWVPHRGTTIREEDVTEMSSAQKHTSSTKSLSRVGNEIGDESETQK